MLPSMPVNPVESVCLFLNSVEVGSYEIDNQGYVLLMASDMELKQVTYEISVAREYPDVFPNDISEFPPAREIEFSIDQIPRMRAISIAPYRMSPMELAELKSQMEKLLEKKLLDRITREGRLNRV